MAECEPGWSGRRWRGDPTEEVAHGEQEHPRRGEWCRVRQLNTSRSVIFAGTVIARSTYVVMVRSPAGAVRTFPLIGVRLD